MNARLMRDYVEYVADFLLVELDFAPLFGKKNPVRMVLYVTAWTDPVNPVSLHGDDCRRRSGELLRAGCERLHRGRSLSDGER